MDYSEGPLAFSNQPMRNEKEQNELLKKMEVKKKSRKVTTQEPSNRASKVGNTDWCRCGKCIPMQTTEESKCCMGLSDETWVNPLGERVCITENPHFNAEIL